MWPEYQKTLEERHKEELAERVVVEKSRSEQGVRW